MKRVVVLAVLVMAAAARAGVPVGDPAAGYGLGWTGKLGWGRVVDVTKAEGKTMEEKLEGAQRGLGKDGGVVYFPAGEYRFTRDIVLQEGVVLRGERPVGVSDARKEGYVLGTRFEFPKYEPTFEGEGTPVETAFKAIRVAEPGVTSNVGVVDIAINRGHIDFGEGEGHAAGKNRLVYGCTLQNAAVADPSVPNRAIGQHGWQRWTMWKGAAISVYTGENALVANCRLVPSTDSFVMGGYVIKEHARAGGKIVTLDEVVFDYDNRAGIVVNGYALGGTGGADPKGTPEMYPWGFRKGIVIRDNYVYSTGRTAIHFTGDGTIASFNVIRMKPDVLRVTNTGTTTTSGSSTNDNRAMTIRGWRWTVEGNDYEVYRNKSADGRIYINDGEGLMHEGHANCAIKDSKLINNKGNAYISIYLTAGIDGLLVEGNDIRPSGPGTDTRISSIFVVSDRNWDRHYLKNVRIVNNVTSGSGISIVGAPAENNLVKGNKHVGDRPGVIVNGAKAVVEDNEGYTVTVSEPNKPLADPNRASLTQPATRRAGR